MRMISANSRHGWKITKLKMNDAKTEFIVIGTASGLRKNTLDHVKIGNIEI